MSDRKFIFEEQFKKSIDRFDDPAIKLDIYEAIVNYGLYGENTGKTVIAQSIVDVLAPQLKRETRAFDSYRQRVSPDYQRWRKEVLKRDGYKCQLCGSTERLEVHHVKSFAEHPELRNDMSNGMTVCAHCHKLLHKIDRDGEI